MKTIISNNYRNVDIYVYANKNSYCAYATYGKGTTLLKDTNMCAIKATGHDTKSVEEGELKGILRVLNALPYNARIQFHGAKMVKANRHNQHKKNPELWELLVDQLQHGKDGLARHTVAWDDEKVAGWNCDATWCPKNAFPTFGKELKDSIKVNAKSEAKVVAKADKGVKC